MAREDSFFDDLARGLADGSITRGKALRLMGAAVVGGTLGSLGISGEAAAAPKCKPVGKHCNGATECCSGNCSSRTCQEPTTTTTTSSTTSTSTTTSTTSTTTPMCLPDGGTCGTNSECCSGLCASGLCAAACTSDRVLLSNGTCAIPCSPTFQDCPDPHCTCCHDTSGANAFYCAQYLGSLASCAFDRNCPTGEICNGGVGEGGRCLAAC